jgi:NAD(P)-dependent dehydrogenase (short-subunit alcohol dehydrogenase family)
MKGKVCVVTGATDGIGLATAEGLARLGARVLAVGRNAEKGRKVVAWLQSETGNPDISFIRADLSSQAQVRSLARDLVNASPQVQVLVNNVGGFFLRRTLSVDGIEATLALNHFNVFLLTSLLLDQLKASAPARIVNVASETHRNARLDLDQLVAHRWSSGMAAYGQSKLAMILFTYEIARRLQDSGVTVNAVHPGLVASNMYRSSGGLVRVAEPFVKLMGKTPEEGADTVIYLAASTEVEGISGKYFVNRHPFASSPASYDEASAQRLWEISTQMVGLS